MSACCARETQPAVASSDACPLCGRRGVRVDPITLKALLVSDALRRGIPPAPRFCETPECSVVYFDAAVGVTFTEADVSVPVYAKQGSAPDVPVCYCFEITRRMVRAEAERGGAEPASRGINREVKAGHCACEVRNPKGSCCLGDVVSEEKGAMGEEA